MTDEILTKSQQEGHVFTKVITQRPLGMQT